MTKKQLYQLAVAFVVLLAVSVGILRIIDARVRDNYRHMLSKIEVGSPEESVREILGEPTGVLSDEEYREDLLRVASGINPRLPDVSCSFVMSYNHKPNIIMIFMDKQKRVISTYYGRT